MTKKKDRTGITLTPTEWMAERNWEPQGFQEDSWRALSEGKQGIVNAPTGSGKTYSLLLPFILECLGRTDLPDKYLLIWITPIRALAKEIKQSADRVTTNHPNEKKLRIAIRTGDTSESEKAIQRKNSPHILITTPESLHLLLARKGCGQLLDALELVVVDEWHELMGTKRGVMMELALARLRGIHPKLKTWGISATIGNLPEALEHLLGTKHGEQGVIIRSHLKKKIDVISILPQEVEKMPWSGHLGVRMIKAIVPIVEKSNSSLIFTNVRSQCELWYRALLEASPSLAGAIAVHHGSISKEIRNWVEDALYEGRLKSVVCTSSLDLGVDFAPVETIIQIGGPKGVARFLQRAGRSGHRPGADSTIYFLPTHSLELLEAAALRQAINDEFIESREPVIRCFDVLIQFLVTLSVGDGFNAEEIQKEVITTRCYQSMSESEWKWIIAFIAYGGTALSAYPEYNRIVLQDGIHKIANQRLARRQRMSIGTIVSDTMMAVKMKRHGLLGHVEESFIAQMKEGDNFWFAGMNVELVSVKELTATVRKSTKPGGRSPAWLGGRLPLSSNMSVVIRKKMTEALGPVSSITDPEIIKIKPLLDLQKSRSAIPTEDELLIEKFHTNDGYHLLFYPFEGRFVHEGLAALFAYRISKLLPISFSLAYNDYGFELLSDKPIPIEEALTKNLLSTESLEQDLLLALNATELAKRRFKEIAAISGLIFKGYPGQPIKERHLQSSSQLIFQVLEDYDPQNLLLKQAYDEVINSQLEMPRLRAALARIGHQRIILKSPEKPTPFAFPIVVDRLRERMSSESLMDRIARMTVAYEK